MKPCTAISDDQSSLEQRMHQEIEAALRCDDAKAAAAHVELANRYLAELTAHDETSDAFASSKG